jgi:ATP-dependent DNA helicase RecQ
MERLGGLGIVHVVIDEAHCVSEWGESFRPSYLEISRIVQAADAPIITAFTATASAPVLEKIGRFVFGESAGVHRIIGNPDRSNIRYSAQGCLRRDLAVRDLILQNQRPAIVFCSSRPGTENLARYLRHELGPRPGFAPRDIRFYHAGLSREEKAETEAWFFNNPQGILVSTCAYGMGVDKADIRTVIHRDCPPSVEAYLQESGRAGRDGAQSRAILLWGPDDEGTLRRADTETGRRRVTELLEYARNTTQCRRQALLALLNYQGEGDSPESACCDVCDGAARGSLREEPSLIAFFRKNRRRYTLAEAVRVLSQREELDWSEDEARETLRDLVKAKKLRIIKKLWKNKLTLGKDAAGR